MPKPGGHISAIDADGLPAALPHSYAHIMNEVLYVWVW